MDRHVYVSVQTTGGCTLKSLAPGWWSRLTRVINNREWWQEADRSRRLTDKLESQASKLKWTSSNPSISFAFLCAYHLSTNLYRAFTKCYCVSTLNYMVYGVCILHLILSMYIKVGGFNLAKLHNFIINEMKSLAYCWLELLICLYFPMAATGTNKEGVSLWCG